MEKIWLKNYPSSVSADLPELETGLLGEFEKTCQKFQDQTAFISFGVRLSYKNLYQKSQQIAQFLKEKGPPPNSVIAIQLPNLLQYPVSLWGSLMAGLKILNLNPLYTTREMLSPLQETQAQGIILLPDKLKELEAVINQTQLRFICVTQPGDLLVNVSLRKGSSKKDIFLKEAFSKTKSLNFAKKHIINLAYKYKTKTYEKKDLTSDLRNQYSFLSAFKKEYSENLNPVFQKNIANKKKTQEEGSNETLENKYQKENLEDSFLNPNDEPNNLEKQKGRFQNQTFAKQAEDSQYQNFKKDQENYDLLNDQRKSKELSDKSGFSDKPGFHKESSGNLNRTLFIQYTGGTTGVVKGACLSEGNVLSNAKQCQNWMGHWLKESEETALAALPLYHIFSFTVNGLVFFFHGYPNVLIADPRNIKSLIRTLKKQKITVGTGVNTLFKALVLHKKFKSIKKSQLKIFVSGGMALDPSVREKWESMTKGFLVEGYGLTEASPVICVDRLDGQKDNSSGYPLPSTEVRIVGEDNNELQINQVGELEVKGPQIMQGYHKQKEETKKVLSSSGWLKTGDLAKINPRGGIEILDRKKDLINVSGLKVYPREVEELLSLHPKVREVAIVGRRNKQKEEIVKAYIVKKQDSLTKKEILSYCKKNLAPYKIPKEISFQKSFIKNAVGKPLKRTLK